MTKIIIEELIASIDKIPPLPEISTAVLAELNSDEIDIIKLSDLIEKDIALATQILKVANSPAYGASRTISTLHHAIIMLGVSELKNLLLAFAVQEFFSQSATNIELRQRFWSHSRVCSYSALMLAQHYKLENCSIYFLAGLVHDIGKLITDQFLQDEYTNIIEYMKKYNCSSSEAEEKIVGIGHALIGKKLLSQWNFPDQIISLVSRHHTPWKDTTTYTTGSTIIFLANILTKMTGYTCVAEERVLTIEEFNRSTAMHFINKNVFKLDVSLIEKFITHINEYPDEDIC